MLNEESKESSQRFISAESKRLVTKIFKFSLNILEDLRQQHLGAAVKLNNLTPEQLESLNYLDSLRYSILRKRVLDNGNECIRDLENLLDYFEFKFKNNKEPVIYKKEKGNDYNK